ncbi:hypothetical protein BCAR13_890038 [Paraburkholderia caribensis]|uniref:DUF6387 family protein n=1 Tax=Paraburkholderia caribensis TaxID=75105 RepID=UPI001CB5AFD2|nr:DUF6387 family protein [Paraburkholderia caribensis]CAG9239449.1 hypothetical protein BCAR13_890038 [Paraburkholderia caribensis]
MPNNKRASAQATKQDLAWFELENYGGLNDFTALNWSHAVGDRLAIRRAIDGGNPEAITAVFETLKATPLKWLGSDIRYTGANHVANTETVKSMNFRRLAFIANELKTMPQLTPAVETDSHGCDEMAARPDAVVDELLEVNPESPFQRFAHLTVSLDAPRDWIVDDFKKWLELELERRKLRDPETTNGDYMKKAKVQWIPHRAVPWYDLDLFERLTGLSVPSAFRWNNLFPGVKYEALDSKKKNVVNAAALLFSEETYQALRRLANNPPLSQAHD